MCGEAVAAPPCWTGRFLARRLAVRCVAVQCIAVQCWLTAPTVQSFPAPIGWPSALNRDSGIASSAYTPSVMDTSTHAHAGEEHRGDEKVSERIATSEQAQRKRTDLIRFDLICSALSTRRDC